MNIKFFGGANEVGASSTLIEIDEKRILVDAGIRMNVEPDKKFPDLEALRQVGLPDVVLLTHAHTDHTGALPELEKMLPPYVRVYCIGATMDITKVLLNDAAGRSEESDYQNRVDNALWRMPPTIPFGEPITICEGVTATWIPAGHILGAAMIHIQGTRESVLMTGDVSSPNQLTIPGMDSPPLQPDVMVMESTYGNRRHVDIHAERQRLVSDVARVIKGGGKVLLPVFAVGRAQEVILILKEAMERGDIECPVYVDGMVRDINRVYANHGEFLLPSLRRQLERDDNIFCPETSNITEVSRHTAREERDSILTGEPCCIVTSSGMLNGGMSSWYAKRMAKDSANLIGLTGYQAEGNPGHALEKLIVEEDPNKRFVRLPADQEKDSVQKDGEAPSLARVQVLCEVPERYKLSAHADKNQLTELIEHAQPRKLFLVHGDDEAREKLSRTIRENCPAVDVKLPKNGQDVYCDQFPGIAGGRTLTHDRILSAVRDYVVKLGIKGPFTARALSEKWFGTKRTTRETVDFLRWALRLPNAFFVPLPGRDNAYEVKSQ